MVILSLVIFIILLNTSLESIRTLCFLYKSITNILRQLYHTYIPGYSNKSIVEILIYLYCHLL